MYKIWNVEYESLSHCDRFRRNTRNPSSTLKQVRLLCNLLLVLQSQVTNAIVNSFLKFLGVFTI